MRCCRLYVVLLLVLGSIGCVHTTQPDRERPPEVKREAALDSVQQVSASTARSNDSLVALRRAYVRGNYETVVRRAHQLEDARSEGDAVQVQVLLGRAEQARGNHKAAIDAFRTARTTAVEADRSIVYIDRALGESYVALYRWPAAASAFQRVLDSRPDDRAARLALAEAYRRSRQWEDARRQYRRLVRRDSSNGQWWARLGNCEVELGKIGAAIQHFERAHELLPQHADVALSLSRFFRATLKPDAARRVVDTTLHYRPGDARLWRRRADLAFERKNFDRARHAYERAIATGDSSATSYRRIGMIDVKNREYERALTSLQSSIQRDSTHTRTMLYLGIAYRNLDRLEQASTFLRRTIDEEAEGPLTDAFVHRGLLRGQSGDVSEAVQSYRMALRLRPQRTDVYFHLANLYDEHYREKKTAARYYRRFLQVSDSTQASFRTYARDRLETLKSTLHMQGAPVPRDSAPDE